MKIVCLVENSKGHPMCEFEHGLSLFIKTQNHNIIFDAGQTDISMKNAEVLGIDIEKVDTLVLSHGHYDHSGGIKKFCKINKNAKIYAHKDAILPHYHGERYIGVNPKITENNNLILIDNNQKIDNELFIFSGIKGRKLFPRGNFELEKEENGIKEPDDFSHEQCLVISENGKNILLSGCAHNGIINILDKYNELFGADPYAVISGFHMMKNTEYTSDDINIITETAKELSRKNTIFYSGHCTGQFAYDLMKDIMGNKLFALHSGETILEI